jgi:ABC-type antimicrobial peptide transport system permease subunit
MTVTVIGVVKASKTHSLIDEERPCAYWPIAQDARTTPALLVRTTGDPQSLIPVIRKEAAALGLNRVCQVSTVADRIAGRLFPQRAVTMVLNVFALAGIVLCITGLYSVISYAAKQRTREIGIRMALGAEARHVFLSVLGKGTWLAGIGLALGLVGSGVAIGTLQLQLADLQRWDRFVLHGVNLWDPVTLIVAPLLVFAIALLACFFPARRAAGIDPMAALRYE